MLALPLPTLLACTRAVSRYRATLVEQALGLLAAGVGARPGGAAPPPPGGLRGAEGVERLATMTGIPCRVVREGGGEDPT